MKKVGRNDPCPCGSGKKYKRCCGQNNVINFSAEPYNDELIELIYELHEFALENFNHELQEIYDEFWNEFYLEDLSDTTLELIAGYTITWAIFNEQIYQGKTIFDIFYHQQFNRIKYTRTKRVFKSWAKVKGSVYLVTSLKEQNNIVAIRDIVTGNTYHFRLLEEQDVKVGRYLIGITIPLVNNEVEFFPAFIQMERNSMEFVFMMLDEVGFNEVEANDRFIEIVIEILCESEESTLDWDNPLYGRIAEVFAQEMERKQYDNSLIQKGILFWHLYCKRHSPRIKNPKIYVATLEYFTLDSFAFDERKTQKEVAQAYAVSPNSISYIHQKFIDTVEQLDVETMLNDEDLFI